MPLQCVYKMLTLAIFSPEGQLLVWGLTMEETRIYERQGLIVKMIKTPHIELMDDGAEEENEKH